MAMMDMQCNSLNSLPKPPLIRCLVSVTLTQAWQCDISFVDSTIPSVTSAHTGSAPRWGAVRGTGSTHSRGRVNVFIHLTDCMKKGVIHIDSCFLGASITTYIRLSRNQPSAHILKCPFQPHVNCIHHTTWAGRRGLHNIYSGAVSSGNCLFTQNVSMLNCIYNYIVTHTILTM